MGAGLVLRAEAKQDGVWKAVAGPSATGIDNLDLFYCVSPAVKAIFCNWGSAIYRNSQLVTVPGSHYAPPDASVEVAGFFVDTADSPGDYGWPRWFTLRTLLDFPWNEHVLHGDGLPANGITYADACHDFLTDARPALEKLGRPDEVRIIAWIN